MRDLNRLSKAELIDLVGQLRANCHKSYIASVYIDIEAYSEDDAWEQLQKVLDEADEVVSYDIRSIDCDC